MRAHFRSTIVDDQGNVLTGASVRLCNPGSTDLISTPIYGSADSPTPLGNPFASSDGDLSVYADAPIRVRIGISVGANPEFFYEDVDLLLVPTTSNIFVQTTAPGSPVAGVTAWLDTSGI